MKSRSRKKNHKLKATKSEQDPLVDASKASSNQNQSPDLSKSGQGRSKQTKKRFGFDFKPDLCEGGAGGAIDRRRRSCRRPKSSKQLRIRVDAITKASKHLTANVAKDLIVWLLGRLTKIVSRLEEEDVILAEDLTREALGTLILSITK